MVGVGRILLSMRCCKRNVDKGSPDLVGPNALSSNRMTTAERLTEVASILAAGLVRLRARQSSRLSGERENSFVDFTAHQSGHAVELEPAENDA
jgi:hypothetical protein